MAKQQDEDNHLWQPLAGLVILDVSQGIAGPYCAAIMRTEGASVYKVEPPTGDWGRQVGTRSSEMSALSASVNGGKQSICIDASQPDGAGLIARLAQKADVVIESFRPGVAARVGLDANALQKANPHQIILSISGFGESGPGAKRPGSDSVLQAMTGMMHLNATPDGMPRMVPLHLIDFAAALYASQLLTLALLEQARTGKGRHIKISLLEVAANFQVIAILEAALADRFESGHLPVPSGVFETQNGFIRLTTLTQRNFEALCGGLDREQWLKDERFATIDARLGHAKEMAAEVAQVLKTKSASQWLEILEPLGVLCAPVNDYALFQGDPQVQAMEIFTQIKQAGLGSIPMPRHPGLPNPPAPAPRLGEHSCQVLHALGVAQNEIDQLLDAKIVWQATDLKESTP